MTDLREHRVPASEEELAEFETDALAGFVLVLVLVLWALAAALSATGNNAVASYFVRLGAHSGLATELLSSGDAPSDKLQWHKPVCGQTSIAQGQTSLSADNDCNR